ncbi:hypothetical protein MCUN1_002319 [Malassezia cuniculi]|uniref:Kinesin motor domain-containing protein n=1 Tax=Malassezia cuniculi TaxID=948313 RepID=A0AAF0EUU7_9BASI|nr:hypothetical protein MCUN1_002319 [Malassezia cuniculi]
MDTDARGGTRPAGFLVLDAPLARPATPRTPFMPSPKKRTQPLVPLRRPRAEPEKAELTRSDDAVEMPPEPPLKRAAPPRTPRAALAESTSTNVRPASRTETPGGPRGAEGPRPIRTPRVVRQEPRAPTPRIRAETPRTADTRAKTPRPELLRLSSREAVRAATPELRREATRTPLRVAPSTAPRAKVTAGIVRARARPAAAPAPLPFAHELCVDADAVQAELGEGSFVLGETHDEACNVNVHIRLRPCAEDEESAWIAAPESATIMLDPSIAATKMQPNVGLPFRFDAVHTGSSNAEVYTSLARPLVQSVLGGYDAMIFAYGQTASGKTFTLSGDEDGLEPGIIVRAVSDVFQGIRQGSTAREYLVRVSYLEIWNEVVRDLLDPANTPQVRDDRRRGPNAVLVAPLHEAVVTTPSAVYALLERGEENRHVGATDWNERSSRSHTCFRITVESRERGASRHVRIGELSLVDLAGSERHTMQGALRRTEGANINRSLLTLGKVIYALSERSSAKSTVPRAAAHVPYRDSKLTRILQNSLSGNARVAVVCTLNPSAAVVEESLSTLNFARRIKKVTVRAQRNEYDDEPLDGAETRALLVRYREEMGALRARVAQLQQGEKSGAKAAHVPQSDSGKAPGAPAESAAPSQADQLKALRERIDELGSLIVQGGSEAPASPPAPPSPAKQRGLDFEDPVHVVQEKLHAALLKIRRLEKRLAARLSLPASAHTDAGKDELIRDLQKQVRELETVCAGQAADAPPLLREDVEREWADRVEQIQRSVEERDAFIAELSAECRRLQRANKRLVRLAHRETEEMVSALAGRPCQPVMSLFAPHLRPPGLGMAGSAPATPLGRMRPLAQIAQAPAPRVSETSIDSGDGLEGSDIDELLSV